MSYRKTSISNLVHSISLDDSIGLEAKLTYLKGITPKISYSQVSLNGEIKCVSITPDERYAIAGLDNGEVQIISIVTTDEEFESGKGLKGHKAEVKCLCVTNDSQCVISGSYDKNIIIWSIHDQKQLAVLKGSEDKVLSMGISKDNTVLVSGSIDNIIRIWDLNQLEQKTVIRSIEGNCYALEITANNNFLILGCSDNYIRLWNIAEHREEAKFEGHTWPVYSLALTSDGQYLISTGMDHTIRKWDMTTYKEIMILSESSETIYSLSITSDNLYVVFGKYNGDIGVVSIDKEMSEVSIQAHKGVVNSVCVSSSSKYIISGSRDGNLQISRLSENPEIQVLDGHKRKVYSLAISNDSQMMASCSEDHTVFIWRLGVEDCEGILKGHKGAVYTAVFTNDLRHCISGGQDQSIIIWDLSTEKIDEELKGHDEAVTCLEIDSKDAILVSGSNDKTIKVWDLSSKSVIFTFKGHTDRVSCLCVNTLFSLIASGSKDKSMRIWNINEKTEVGGVHAHDEEITSIKFIHSKTIIEKSRKMSKNSNSIESDASIAEDLSSGDRVITSSLDKTIKIWNVKTLEVEYSFPCKKEVFKMCLSSDNAYLFVQTSKRFINMWSIPDKQELICLYDHPDLTAIALSPDKRWLVYTSGTKIFMVKSPLNRDNTYTVLPYTYSYLFKILIHRILNNDKSQKNTLFSTYFICPFNVSLLHILTFASHNKMLKRAIANGAKFFKTRSGETPLSIALSRKSKICAEILIKMFSSDELSEKPYIFEYLKGLLPVLNLSSLPSLHILYQHAFPIVESSELPTFGTFAKSPPVLLMTESWKIDPNQFIPIKKEIDHTLTDSEVEFRRSLLSLDLSPGSKKCINLMRSILQCSNTEIFRTEFIKTLLKYKWRQIRWVLILQACLYLLLVIDIMVHTLYDRKSLGPIIVELVLNTFFLAYEASQAFSGIASYFTDIWNILDASRIIVLYLHCIVTLIDVEDIVEDVFLMLLNIIAWSRLIGYFRIFDGTRYLIHMLTQVIADLGPFLVLFVLSTLGATFTFYSNSYSKDFGDMFLATYGIAYGAWNFEQDNDLKYTIFFCVSLINTLVLLNLLIALISDTYQRVREQLDIVDMQELADIILEVDSIMFWNRKRGQQGYLVSCNVAGSHKKNKNFESETKLILKTITEIDNRSKRNERSMEKLSHMVHKYSSTKVTGKSDWIMELIGSIKNDFSSLKTEMQAEIRQVKHDISSVKSELRKVTNN